MRRRFRWWPKKRGSRRTVSPLWGSLGEAMFYSLLFLLGATSLAAMFISNVLEPGRQSYAFGFGFWLLLLVLASFLLIGGGGLIYTILRVGTSAERRSALARRAASIELLSEAMVTPRDYPSLPSDSNLTNSPGIKFAFRLPTEQSPLWQFSAAAIFGLLWNGLAIGLVIVAIKSHIQQRPDLLLTMLCVPFVLVGFWSARHLYGQIVVLTVVGPTIVEIAEHPLRPGQCCGVFVSQGGHDTFESLSMELVCQEEATYRQGTDVRVDVATVARIPIFAHPRLDIEPGKPFEHHDTFQIPADSMHSFQSPHNRVLWYLSVHGAPKGRRPFQRNFPLVVYPAVSTQPASRSRPATGLDAQQASAS